MRNLFISSVIMALCWLDAPTAEACSCAAPKVQIFPEDGQIAPTNTKILVFDDYDKSLTKSSLIKVTVNGKSVPFEAKEFTSNDLHGWVLTPKRPLKAESTVKVTAGKSKFSFFTGKVADSDAPTLSDYKATPQKSPAPTGMCSSGNSYVQFELDSSTETIERKEPAKLGGAGSTEATIIKVWVDERGKAIDFTKEPTFYNIAYNKKAQLSKSSLCAVDNYALNALSGKTIQIGLSLLDAAGNESKQIEKSVVIK